MKSGIRLIAVLLVLAGPAAYAATPMQIAADPRVADAVHAWETWLEYQAAVNGIPAVTTAIVHDQEVLATRAFGWADVAARRPATTDTLFSICSISKLFTSIAVMQLRDAGRLRLDDPVRSHLGWFDIHDVHGDDEVITVGSLLSHSAGLPRESDHPYWTAPGYPFPSPAALRETLKRQQTLYPASRFFQYSNLGMSLAGEIVASLSGRSYADHVRESILDPLGMSKTHTDMPDRTDMTGLAIGYSERRRDGSRIPLEPFRAQAIAPAAGFASTAGDLARFAMWQHRLLSGSSDSVLRAATLREMQRVHWIDPDWSTTRGLGFEVNRESSRTLVGHSGACPGYSSHLRLEPQAKLAVVVLANAIGVDTYAFTTRAFDLVGPAVAKALDAKGSPPPVRDPGLDKYVGIYVTDWNEIAVLRWEGSLALLVLGSRDPASALVRLKPAGRDTFTVVRKDDATVPGDPVVFELTADGTVMRFRQHSSQYERHR